MPRTSRSRSRRNSNSPVSTIKRSIKARTRSRRSSGFLGMPGWVTLSLGILGACGLVYGLMQIETISDFVDPVIHDVGDFFGLTEDEGIDTTNLTHDRTYSGSYTSVGSSMQ